MAALALRTASSTAALALLGLDLGGSADLDDGHAAGELGQALLELLTVVSRRSVFSISALDLGHASVDGFLGASAADDDGGLVLGDGDGLGGGRAYRR